MKHLTIANYFSQSERKAPACYVSNFVSGFEIAYEVKASFTNCIIFGSHDTEVMVGKVKEADLEASFQNCLVKAKENSNYFIDCIRNEDPKFTDIKKLDFKLLFSSPAIGRGKENIGVPYDILGNSRNNPPDIGAYQFVR